MNGRATYTQVVTWQPEPMSKHDLKGFGKTHSRQSQVKTNITLSAFRLDALPTIDHALLRDRVVRMKST